MYDQYSAQNVDRRWDVQPIVVAGDEKKRLLESVGGRILEFEGAETSISWRDILVKLAAEGVKSVMIEGGGAVINDLLAPAHIGLVDTVIVTIAPVWLGKGGVQVCPDGRVEGGQRLPVSRLRDVTWVPLGEDVVLFGFANTV